jgi:hypothetical protein
MLVEALALGATALAAVSGRAHNRRARPIVPNKTYFLVGSVSVPDADIETILEALDDKANQNWEIDYFMVEFRPNELTPVPKNWWEAVEALAHRASGWTPIQAQCLQDDRARGENTATPEIVIEGGEVVYSRSPMSLRVGPLDTWRARTRGGGAWTNWTSTREPSLRSKGQVAQALMGQMVYHFYYFDEAGRPMYVRKHGHLAKQAWCTIPKRWVPLLVVRGGIRVA